MSIFPNEIPGVSEKQGLTPLLTYSSSRASYTLDSRRNSDVFDELSIDDWQRIEQAACKDLKSTYPKSYAFISKGGFSVATPNAIDALVDYLHASAKSDRPLVIPSEMVDVMWKGFIKHEPQLYQEFSEKFIGKVIEPNAQTDFKEASKRPDFDDRLCESWVALYRQANVSPGAEHAPALFNVDANASMVDRRAFFSTNGMVQSIEMGANGWANGARVDHPGISLERMVGLKIINEQEFSIAQKEEEISKASQAKVASYGKFQSILNILAGPTPKTKADDLYSTKIARHAFIY